MQFEYLYQVTKIQKKLLCRAHVNETVNVAKLDHFQLCFTGSFQFLKKSLQKRQRC